MYSKDLKSVTYLKKESEKNVLLTLKTQEVSP